MVILHGENTVLSRHKLIGFTQNFKGEIVRLEGGKMSLTDLKQAVESSSLFGQKRLVIVENLFTRRPSTDKEKLLKYLKEQKSTNLIIWERKTIDGRSLVSFRFAQIEKFVIPAIIFKFLDSLSPNNKKNALNFFHQILRQEPPEMVFYMLTRRIRNLLIVKDLGEKGLEKMAPWQKAKLARQAKQFNLKQLLFFYQNLLRIDWQQKTGRAPMPLISQLDLLIASL